MNVYDKYIKETHPVITEDDPILNRQFVVESSWGVRAAYFQHNWGTPHFQDVGQHVDEGSYHEDSTLHDCRFKVFTWK